MKFKTEIFLLLTSMALFLASIVCYSYATGSSTGLTLALASYPYRAFAIPIVSCGSVLMALATFSYAKRSKSFP